MNYYDDLVETAKPYFGFGATLFVDRALRTIGQSKETVSKKDIPKLLSNIDSVMGNSLKPEKKKRLREEIKEL